MADRAAMIPGLVAAPVGGATLAFSDATYYRYSLACILYLACESREAFLLL